MKRDPYLSYVRRYMEQEAKHPMRTPLFDRQEYNATVEYLKEFRAANQLSNLPRDIALSQVNVSYTAAKNLVEMAKGKYYGKEYTKAQEVLKAAKSKTGVKPTAEAIREARKTIKEAKEKAIESGDAAKIPSISELRDYKETTWKYTHTDGKVETKTGTSAQALYMNYLDILGREEADDAFGYV